VTFSSPSNVSRISSVTSKGSLRSISQCTRVSGLHIRINDVTQKQGTHKLTCLVNTTRVLLWSGLQSRLQHTPVETEHLKHTLSDQLQQVELLVHITEDLDIVPRDIFISVGAEALWRIRCNCGRICQWLGHRFWTIGGPIGLGTRSILGPIFESCAKV
jgi:hypothetical protein